MALQSYNGADAEVTRVIDDMETAFIDKKELQKLKSLRKITNALEKASAQRAIEVDAEKIKREQEEKEKNDIINQNKSDVTIKLLNRDYYRHLADTILGQHKECYVDEISVEKMMNMFKTRVMNLDDRVVHESYKSGRCCFYRMRKPTVTSAKSADIVVTFQIFKEQLFFFKNSVQHYCDVEVRFQIQVKNPKRNVKLNFEPRSGTKLAQLEIIENTGGLVFDTVTILKDLKGKEIIDDYKFYEIYRGIKQRATGILVEHFVTIARDFKLNVRQMSGCNEYCPHGNGIKVCSDCERLRLSCGKELRTTIPVNYIDVVTNDYIDKTSALETGYLDSYPNKTHSAILFVRKLDTAFVTPHQYKKFAEHCGHYVIFLNEEEPKESKESKEPKESDV